MRIDTAGSYHWTGNPNTTLTGTAAEGITEIDYQPTGPDIPGDLETFLAVLPRRAG